MHGKRESTGLQGGRKRTYQAVAWLVVLFGALTQLDCDHIPNAQAEFNRVLLLFQRGELAASQQLAASFADNFEIGNPAWAASFRILEAESAAWRGINQEVVRILSNGFPAAPNPEITIKRLSLLGLAHAHLHQFTEAERELLDAQNVCARVDNEACGGLVRSRAGLAIERGQYSEAYELYSQSLSVARRFGQRFDESAAMMNLGGTCLLEERYDEAINWFRAANLIAIEVDAGDILATDLGNLGWAYYRIGDTERAQSMFEDAEQRSVTLGDEEDAISWLTTAGVVYQDSHQFVRARESYRRALDQAREINSKDDIVNSLELLARVSIDAGNPSEAAALLDQLAPLIRTDSDHLDELDVAITQGMIAISQHQVKKAEELLGSVELDPASPTYMVLDAEHQIARLLESQNKPAEATRMYKTALTTFELSRARLKEEASRLPFFTNAESIYDDYIQLLVKQGKWMEALAAADQSRARSLAEGLGLVSDKQSFHPAAFSPRAVAQKTDATLLFYWLSDRQSYLWAITPERIELFPIPDRETIRPLVERYQMSVLGLQDPVEADPEDGLTLFRLLIAPASQLIRSGAPVMILADGILNHLNFETLLVPGPGPFAESSGLSRGTIQNPHYWIDDATLLSAPSLAMLAATNPARDTARTLLLFGNPASPNRDFPSLPLFGFEMAQIEKNFAGERVAVFERQRANPSAYLSSDPGKFSYIHFVAHAVSSSSDPLDSAIILSGSGLGEDSFKLYARDIIKHPIDARLVTISSCYGSGTRIYAGEGLVGLAWAFLRAGAHNTIGALWEVSDDSTPRLMGTLYQGLEEGKTPATALRNAKLDLLHSRGRFSNPFYWATFQLYTR